MGPLDSHEFIAGHTSTCFLTNGFRFWPPPRHRGKNNGPFSTEKRRLQVCKCCNLRRTQHSSKTYQTPMLLNWLENPILIFVTFMLASGGNRVRIPWNCWNQGWSKMCFDTKNGEKKKHVATKKRSQHLELKLHYMSCLGVSQ